LKIAGDSMIGRGIHNNDYILVLPASRADDGDIVAARIGEDATVKTITYRDGQTVLVPANPADREIVVDANTDFSLLGTVCGVFRPFQEVSQ
jgi:SOS-response transcriptional repressor LexA